MSQPLKVTTAYRQALRCLKNTCLTSLPNQPAQKIKIREYFEKGEQGRDQNELLGIAKEFITLQHGLTELKVTYIYASTN